MTRSGWLTRMSPGNSIAGFLLLVVLALGAGVFLLSLSGSVASSLAGSAASMPMALAGLSLRKP